METILIAGLVGLLVWLGLGYFENKRNPALLSTERQRVELQKQIMLAKMFFVALHEVEEDEKEQRNISKTIRMLDAALGTDYTTMTFSDVEELIKSYQGMVDNINEAVEAAREKDDVNS